MVPPDELDLTKYQLHRHLPLRYRLSSIVSHSGEVGVGHFLAVVKGQGESITCISDEHRHAFTLEQMLESPHQPRIGNPKDHCILIYTRKDGVLSMKQKEMKRLMD